MPNLIKYSTSAVTYTIKKGNIVLGVNNVDYGPTSTSGFYNGITPPISGYTFYINKPSGGPSIYVSTGDTQTIQLIQSLGGTGSTIENTLSWVASQSDIVVSNRDYENIVTSGMVLNLDAGFTGSYPKGNQQWYDMSGSGNTGTLINGPTFNPLSGGSVVFDGVDDYCVVNSNSNTSLSGNFSITQWYRASTNAGSSGPSGGYRILFETNGYRNGTLGFAIYQFTSYFRIFRIIGSTYTELITTSGNTVGLNTWKTFTLVRNSGVFTFYIDTISSGTYTTDTNNYSDTSYHIGGDGPPTSSYWFQGNIATTQIYNRALTQSEVTQNYNALKDRYGL